MKICPACQTEFKDGTMRFCTKDGTPLIAFVPPVAEEPEEVTPPEPEPEPESEPVEIVPPPALFTPTPIVSAPLEPPSLDATSSDIPVSPNRYPAEPSFDPAVSLDSNLDSDLDSDYDSDLDFSANDNQKIEIPVEEPKLVEPVAPIPTPKTTVAAAASTAAPFTPAQKSSAPPPPKRKSNLALFAILGVIGVFGLLGVVAAAGAYYYYASGNNRVAVANTNVNAENTNSITTNSDSTDNENSEVSVNANTNNNENNDPNINANTDDIYVTGLENLNANARPSPTPRASPSPTPRSANRNDNRIVEIGPSQPSPTPEIRQPSTPPPTPQQTGTRTIAGGVVNGRATSLPKPPYPSAARAVRAEGQVNVQVLIDERGNVVSASAISGNTLLRQAAAQAARQAKFSPAVVSGQPVRVSGVIIYNFTMN